MISGTDPLRRPLAALLAIGALAIISTSGPYGHELIANIAIFAIFAISLDFLVGFVGLVSMGHAGFLGVGGYAFAYFSSLLGWPAWAGMLAAVFAGAIVSGIVGFFAVRVRGVFFIMVTLALSMMFHAWAFKNRTFNSDDGLTGLPRLDLSTIGIDLADPRAFGVFVLVALALVWSVFEILVRSPFGQVLIAIRQNESRMRALGCSVRRYKLAAFTVAGTFAALAGSLMAQQDAFVNPHMAYWLVSGEVLIVVIIGGMGTLLGPVLGAGLVIYLRHLLSSATEHWAMVMGAVFIIVVLVAPDGIYGRANGLLRTLQRRRQASTLEA